MNVASHQEKEKNEKAGKKERERERQKIEKGRPISKRLLASLLRSFRGSTAKKWFA